MPTTVVLCQLCPACRYVGRCRDGMHFGNPFSHRPSKLPVVRVPTPRAAVDAFRAWLAGTDHQDVEPERRRWVLDNLHTLRGRRLGCYCGTWRPGEPRILCHAVVLAEMADALPEVPRP